MRKINFCCVKVLNSPTLAILISLIIFFSCSEKKLDKEWQEVLESSSIMKYQDFLFAHPDSAYLKAGLDSLRLLWEIEVKTNKHHPCHGNCLILLINERSQLLFEREIIAVSELSDKLIYSIINPENLDHLPEKKITRIDNFGEVESLSVIIDIKSDKNVNLKFYTEIIEIIKQSILSIKMGYSQSQYKKPIESLSKTELEQLDKMVHIWVQMERYIAGPPDITPPLKFETDKIIETDIEIENIE